MWKVFIYVPLVDTIRRFFFVFFFVVVGFFLRLTLLRLALPTQLECGCIYQSAAC